MDVRRLAVHQSPKSWLTTMTLMASKRRRPAPRAAALVHGHTRDRLCADTLVLERPGVGAPLEDQGQLPWSWLYDYGAAASW